jgi:hypothetical protein
MKKICVFLSVLLPLLANGASTINTTNAYSYGANIGWMNWRPDSDATNTQGVVVGEFICSGYVYAANVGWINMGNGAPANNIQYQNNSATDFGVNYTTDPAVPGVGFLRGYAYGANIGWINFDAPDNPFPLSVPKPTVSLFTGNLSGYAYSANCGWITLNALDAGSVLRFVQTDHLAKGVDTNGNGIADAWEYLYFGGLLAPGQQNTSPNGSGMTLLQDYRDGVNPLVLNSGLHITAYSTNGGGVSSNVTFTSTTARLYSIETNTDITLPLNWVDSGLGLFAPDAGTSTVRTVTQSSVTKRFFRAKTMQPLP